MTDSRTYRAAHPEKYRAHKLVSMAVMRGELLRQNCERCGEVRTHAHHDDYAKPLEVTWLCAACHKDRHAELDGRDLRRKDALSPAEWRAVQLAAVRAGFPIDTIKAWRRRRIPAEHVQSLAELTGIAEAKMRPDVFGKRKRAA